MISKVDIWFRVLQHLPWSMLRKERWAEGLVNYIVSNLATSGRDDGSMTAGLAQLSQSSP